MQTTTLGRTGLTVSRLGFGGAPAGLTNYLSTYAPENVDQRQQVLAALEEAVAQGACDHGLEHGASALARRRSNRRQCCP